MATFEEVRTITIDGRLVVPWIVQQALGLDHGGPVRFRVEDGVVTLSAAEGPGPRAASPSTTTRGTKDIRAALKEELERLVAAARSHRTEEPAGD